MKGPGSVSQAFVPYMSYFICLVTQPLRTRSHTASTLTPTNETGDKHGHLIRGSFYKRGND